MSTDLAWMSSGGFLLDGNGDLAISSGMGTVISMVRTRLKAAVDGWKQYNIGAGLDQYPGNTSNVETEMAIRRRVLQAISSGYIPPNTFQVSTIRLGGQIQIFVYLKDELIAQTSIDIQPVVG